MTDLTEGYDEHEKSGDYGIPIYRMLQLGGEYDNLSRNYLKTYRYCKLDGESDLEIYHALKERKLSVCILLGGTSGCGKSTLGSFLANRLNISTVISTDHVRHVLRSHSNAEETPILFRSSYDAGEVIKSEQNSPLSIKEQVSNYDDKTHPNILLLLCLSNGFHHTCTILDFLTRTFVVRFIDYYSYIDYPGF
jgi:hypothetical protein